MQRRGGRTTVPFRRGLLSRRGLRQILGSLALRVVLFGTRSSVRGHIGFRLVLDGFRQRIERGRGNGRTRPLLPLLHRKQILGVAGVPEKVDVGTGRLGPGQLVPRVPFRIVLRRFRVQPQRLVVGVLFVLRVAHRTGRSGVTAGPGLLAGLGAAAVDGARGGGLAAGRLGRALVLALLLVAGLLLGLLRGLVLGTALVLLGFALVLLVLVLLVAFGVRGVLAFRRAASFSASRPEASLSSCWSCERPLLVLGALLLPRGRAGAALGVLLIGVAGGGSPS
ncbi:hypothetical protein GCM10011428_53080 [Streptomyces violaceus]|uniref:hypothetical protein n=1 Tax=Streptomyces violaceus TaxID=1936 RepID=UPI0031E531B7